MAFPLLRKTRREVFRVIGRHHLYDHLDRLLEETEALLAHGWKTHQLRASSSAEFSSLVSEVLVARAFVQRGFEIDPTVGRFIVGRKPEFYVRGGTTTAAVEVFKPRDWQRIEEFGRKASHLLRDADVAFDFRARFTLRLEHRFDAQHQLIHPHPGLIERGLELAGADLFATLRHEFDGLAPPDREFVVRRPDANLELDVKIERVEASDGHEPARSVSQSHSLSGYAPEAIFRRIVEKVGAKARRRQAGGAGVPHRRMLLVDLSTSPIQPHLYDGPRHGIFADIVREVLGPAVPGTYDVIVLCDPSWERGLNVRVACAARHADARELLPAGGVILSQTAGTEQTSRVPAPARPDPARTRARSPQA